MVKRETAAPQAGVRAQAKAPRAQAAPQWKAHAAEQPGAWARQMLWRGVQFERAQAPSFVLPQ